MTQTTEVKLRNEHVSILSSPDKWPQWPLMPVKKWSNNEMDCGCVLAIEGFTTTVVKIDMWDFDEKCKKFGKSLGEFINSLEKEVFDSPEAIYDAGWRVD